MTALTEASGSEALTLYYHGREISGWAPVSHMVQVAARLMGAHVVSTGNAVASRPKLAAEWLRPAPRGPAPGALYVARSPAEARAFLCLPDFRRPRRFRALWIIDSFRTEELPSARLLRCFDLVAYCQSYDADIYHARAGDRALLLPWGTDALGLGSAAAERRYDVLRLGRQPDAWDDDAKTAAACGARGLRFHGRPPYPGFAKMHQALMQEWYAQTKFVVAHSNLAAPARYTHANKEYITARWTDALAAGAVVAGMQPHSDLGLLDWPEATLDFDTIDLEANLDQLAQAAARWSPQVALRNHLGALERLDWRWRLKTLCDRLQITAPALENELATLQDWIVQRRATL
ncbi:MAG: hypothetical protein AAF891_08495 [Pseudomonadota bacterium]